MKAKEIILLILIIAGGILVYHIYTGDFDVVFDLNDHFFFNLDEFNYEDYQELEPPFPPLLQIANSRGAVEIQGTEGEKIAISFRKKIWRRKEEQAREVSDQLKMTLSKELERLLISTNRGEFRRKNFETSFKIFLPQNMDVEVENSYDLVKVSKVRKASITNRHGKAIASHIRGELFIKNAYEDVKVENVQSGCRLESRHGDVSVAYVKGKTEISHAYGKVRLENLSQDVKITGSHSEVLGQNLMGAVDIETTYEKIALFDVGPTKVRARHSAVEIEGARGLVDISDNYNKVKVNHIQGNLIIDGRYLEIYGRGIAGQEISITSSYRPLHLSEFSGKTTISLSNGPISLEPLPLTQPIEVKAEYSDIKFLWPQEGKYPIEAKAKNGEIKWNLPFELSFKEENSYTVIKAFSEESGKPSIFLSTTYGKIQIMGSGLQTSANTKEKSI